MLKSAKTSLVLLVTIEGATTLLCIPVRNSRPKTMLDRVKKRWFSKESIKLTTVVRGSLSHCQAPIAVQTVAKMRRILHLIVAGFRHEITSVSLLSNAFRSSHVVCSTDMT